MSLLLHTLLILFGVLISNPQTKEGYILFEKINRSKTQEELKEREAKVRKQISDPILQEKVIRSLREGEREPVSTLFDLAFNTNRTNYNMKSTSHGMKLGITMSFHDLLTNTYTHKGYIFEKAFLIEEQSKSISWELVDSTRALTPFQVKMAKTIVDSVEVTAWYAPEIPISGGPSTWNGLPGMILEIYKSDGSAIKFKSYSVNFDKSLLNKPKKGEIVSSVEIFQQKVQQATDRLNERSRNGEKIRLESLKGN